MTDQPSGKKWEYVEKSEQQEQELKEAMEHELGAGQAQDPDVDIEFDDEAAEYAKLSQVELVKELVKAKKEASNNWDALLRAKAETQNIVNSADKEKQNIRNFAIKSFVQSLVSVIDNFERSLDLTNNAENKADINIDSLIEGIELTRKDFLSTLEKFGVEVLNPVHEKFDPQYHEAMSMLPSGEHEPNTVLQVLQKGYLLNQRLVRPAMVIVSKKAD